MRHELSSDQLPVPSRLSTGRPRLLVAIASYGEKNIDLLQRVIATYRGMALDVDVVVLSEAGKDLGSGVRVVVGLPSRNPWSLPFGHKRIFAENVHKYDLFAYSEDDMQVTQENIQAFLCASEVLEPDEIPGFMRYEVDPAGTYSLPEVHGPFHWKPESVTRRKSYTIAEFSNEHAGFYLLTQAQLQRAIASGGFLRGPCEHRYGMLETAATDVYTQCGFRKVICISSMEHFLIHHMSNRYAGQLGLPLAAFKEQLQVLEDIARGKHPSVALCEVESRMQGLGWSKSYYEESDKALLRLVPQEARQILSVGCGWGATEAKLMQRGVQVTALPLDSVIGAAAAQRGIDVVYATLEDGAKELEARRFDCVLLTNLLHLLPSPHSILERYARLLLPNGVLVVASPNFDYLPIMAGRALRRRYRKLNSYVSGGINAFSIRQLQGWLRHVGLDCDALHWQSPSARHGLNGTGGMKPGLSRTMAKGWNRLREAALEGEAPAEDNVRRDGSIKVSAGVGRFVATDWVARARRIVR